MANIPAAHMRQFTPENLDDIETVVVETDLLIIGGGNAGCFVATEAALVDPNVRVTIMEKAEIMRSGACSAGMDAINTYIPEGKTPEDLVRWSRAQVGGGPLREDLALSNARELNESVDDLERWGLPILRDEQGRIRYRGKWDISIHGEQLKPIMAEKALESGADVYNRVTATALIMHEGRCTGAMGFGVRDGKFYIFRAKATVVSTGGAGTLYKSYTADSTDSGAQIWMCPYCVGTGYVIGFRQGAELTSLEQRWVATRTTDFCGPVDTISVGYGAPIINAHGERVMSRYEHLGGDAAPRYIRANAPMEEWLAGRGPCYCDTTHLTPETAKAMMEDYLNERPSFVLFLASRGQDVTREPIEIYGSDPYILGGHTGGGFWVDMQRMTTIPGLYAIGEANFSDHGANRLGASALMQGLADGYFVLPYTIGDYLSHKIQAPKVKTDTKAFDEAEKGVREKIAKLLSIGGKQSVDDIHKKLGHIMWENVGMARSKESLEKAISEIQALRKEFWKDVKVVGQEKDFNVELEKALRLADFLELGELMARDALNREESCGGHFRVEHQTEEGEAKRDDENFVYAAVWEYKGEDAAPELTKEPLNFEFVHPAQRNYKD